MTTNSTRRLTSSNISMHYDRFVVHTNTIIYNNQQQQKGEKERGNIFIQEKEFHSGVRQDFLNTETGVVKKINVAP